MTERLKKFSDHTNEAAFSDLYDLMVEVNKLQQVSNYSRQDQTARSGIAAGARKLFANLEQHLVSPASG